MHFRVAAISVVAAASSAVAFNQTDENCTFKEVSGVVKAECTFRNGMYWRKVPATFSNMVMTVYSPSGGAVLDPNNMLDSGTRGKGVKFQTKVANNIPKTGEFKIRTYQNGQDATLSASGKRTDRPLSGGAGGKCPRNSTSRFAGSGGDVTIVYFYKDDNDKLPSTILQLGAGGGAGAYSSLEDRSKGGDAALIDRKENLLFQLNNGRGKVDKWEDAEAKTTREIISPGEKGTPSALSGFGGVSGAAAAGGKGIDGGRGQPGLIVNNNEDEADERAGNGGNGKKEFEFCLAGGGGGDGYHPGGGGGAKGSHSGFNGAAGSGGGGSSQINDKHLPMYEIIHQENHYDPDPRVVVTFDVQEPVVAPAGKVPGKGCLIC